MVTSRRRRSRRRDRSRRGTGRGWRTTKSALRPSGWNRTRRRCRWPRRELGGHVDGLGLRGDAPLVDVLDGILHVEDGAGQRAAVLQRRCRRQRQRAARPGSIAIGHATGAHAVGDERDMLMALGVHHDTRGDGVDVMAVADELGEGLILLERRRPPCRDSR